MLSAALLLTTASSYALDLAAVEAEWTPPGSATPIRMWGFIADPGACPAPGPPFVAWTPGPDQVEVAGGTLTINLRNCLTEPVSLIIPGQQTALTPQTFVDGDGRTRVRAFTNEAAAGGGVASYTWNNLKSGTFLYQSGSHPAKQVQMGLFGPVKIGSYAEAADEATLLFSEIDPALHPTASAPSALDYKPKYFLINGQTFTPDGTPPEIPAGRATETLHIRFLNAGYMSHTPTLQGPYMQIVAEDGNPYPFAREEYSALLHAGKTLDALWTPAENGSFVLYDRSLSLSTNGVPGGGMLVNLTAGSARFPWILFIPAITNMGPPVPLP